MSWNFAEWDRDLGRRDRAELLDPPAKRVRPEPRHSAGCVDDEGKVECVCNGHLWSMHPAWDQP